MMALRRLGKALHSTRSRNLIVKTESGNNLPKIGAKVLNKKLSRVGTVTDVFGLVSRPYVAIKPETNELSKHVGDILFFMNDTD